MYKVALQSPNAVSQLIPIDPLNNPTAEPSHLLDTYGWCSIVVRPLLGGVLVCGRENAWNWVISSGDSLIASKDARALALCFIMDIGSSSKLHQNSALIDWKSESISVGRRYVMERLPRSDLIVQEVQPDLTHIEVSEASHEDPLPPLRDLDFLLLACR